MFERRSSPGGGFTLAAFVSLTAIASPLLLAAPAAAAAFDPAAFAHFGVITLESGDPVGQFYSVAATLDTAALVASGAMNASGSDLAVAWDLTGAGGWIEIDAHLRPSPNATLATSARTEVWFALQEPAGVAAYPHAARYRLYWGNPAALPADRRRDGKLVYRFFEDFLPGEPLDATWYIHPSYRPAITMSGGQLHQNGALSPGNVWQGPPIRMITQTAASVPTFSVSYAQPFAGECRFRSRSVADDVRPINYFANLSTPSHGTTHNEVASFIHDNGFDSFRLMTVNSGVSDYLAHNPLVIQANVWYDLKATARLVVATPGQEVALHQLFLDGVLLDDSSDELDGGFDPAITSGPVGITTDPGSAGDYDWVAYRDFTPGEPVSSVDPEVGLRAREIAGGTELYWSAPGGAASYDLIRGTLSLVVAPAGPGSAVALGPLGCIEDDSTDTTTAPDHLDPAQPPPGDGFFYLLRTRTSLGPGLYGHTAAGGLRAAGSGDCF